MIKIENRIPIPNKAKNNEGMSAVLRKLKKGQSVLLPRNMSRTTNILQYICDGGYSHRYTTRHITDSTTRVWKIK